MFKVEFVLIKNIDKDHCHYVGKHRGAVHNKCNWKYSTPNKISIVFHKHQTIIMSLLKKTRK